MTTIKDLVRDFGTQIAESAGSKSLTQEQFDDLLDQLMAEIQKIIERALDV